MSARQASIWIALALLAGWTGFAAAHAADAGAEFDAANKLYEQGKYADAAEAYEKMLQTGRASPAVWFNLGNAQFKSGHIGEALVAYRRVQQITPRDPDIQANLQFARNQVAGPTQRPTLWQRWLATLSLNEWTTLTSGAFWLTFLLLTVIQLRPAWRPMLRNYLVVSAAAVVLLGACLGLALAQRTQKMAFVIVPDVTVRNGPLEESQSAFEAKDGAEFRVLDQKDNWLQVTDGNRWTGWLKRDAVRVL